MKQFLFSLCMACLLTGTARAEDLDKRVKTDANLVGHVVEAQTGEHLPGVSIYLKGTTIGTVTDRTGHYKLMDLPLGNKTIVVQYVGYKTQEREVTLTKGITQEIKFEIEEDVASLDVVVVSANRSETTRRMAPTLVNVIGSKLFESTNAQNLAQGIIFQPGVRVENNCQNCGFNQVRINGMDGRYTQVLIDSRPIVSALAGVYGLEQIPANMIDRVEVVRGGGSALFGSSAIAGVLNIITREPVQNSFTLNESFGLTGMKKLDNNLSFNGSIISDDQKAGAMIFGQMRTRKPWDKDGDGFSEIGEIQSRSLGAKLFLHTSDYSRLIAEIHGIQENRRGGDHIEEGWAEHVVGIAESVRHDIYSGNIKYDLRSSNYRHHFQVYASGQLVNRNSYYGGIGLLEDENGNALGSLGYPISHDRYGDNYGITKGKTFMGGMQYSYDFEKFLFMPAQIMGGWEFTREMLDDVMPIRSWYAAKDENGNPLKDSEGNLVPLYPAITQNMNNWSQFSQIEWKNNQWSILLGVRIDEHSEVDNVILSPRATLRFNPTQDINIRATYAKGFRAPQIFDEDLHVGIVGGEAQKVYNDPNLKPEISHSISLSADIYQQFDEVQTNVLVEGFFTRLNDVFTNVEQPDQLDGIKRYTRVNGSGARIYGANLEAKLAYRKFQLQGGITLANNTFDDAQEWGIRTILTQGKEPLADGSNFKKNAEGVFENEAQLSREITRTPHTYGYLTLGWNPVKPLNISVTGTYTGKMLVPHEIQWGVGSAVSDIEAIKAKLRTPGLVDAEGAAPRWDVLEETPSFVDMGAKISYDVPLTKVSTVQLYAGMTNLFDAFQKDFDQGPNRASSYIYGPTQPRSFYAGCKFSF